MTNDARLVWLLERCVAEWGVADVAATLLAIDPASSNPISGLADPKAPHRANPHFPVRCPDCNGMAWCDCIPQEVVPFDYGDGIERPNWASPNKEA